MRTTGLGVPQFQIVRAPQPQIAPPPPSFFRSPDGFEPRRIPPVNLNGAPGNPNSTSTNEAFPGMNLNPNSPEADLRFMVRQNLMVSERREATETDYAYWLPKLRGECDSGYVTGGQMSSMDYWHNRMLGWQAGGADTAVGGPYAGMDYGGYADSEITTLNPMVDPAEALRQALERTTKKKKGSTTSAVPANLPPRGDFPAVGFDDAKAGTCTDAIKSDAFEVSQRLDPSSPDALAQAQAALETMHPGEFTRDGDTLRSASGEALSIRDGSWSWA